MLVILLFLNDLIDVVIFLQCICIVMYFMVRSYFLFRYSASDERWLTQNFWFLEFFIGYTMVTQTTKKQEMYCHGQKYTFTKNKLTWFNISNKIIFLLYLAFKFSPK